MPGMIHRISTPRPTRVDPPPRVDPKGVWGGRRDVLLWAQGGPVRVWLVDPEEGGEPADLPAETVLTLNDYCGPLWVETGTAECLVIAVGKGDCRSAPSAGARVAVSVVSRD